MEASLFFVEPMDARSNELLRNRSNAKNSRPSSQIEVS
jgi:hypothetical protein